MNIYPCISKHIHVVVVGYIYRIEMQRGTAVSR